MVFHGKIHEIPNVLVDNFTDEAELYLLTHSHTDHLLGLRKRSFDGLVYCSYITKELIEIKRPCFASKNLIPIQYNRCYDISLSTGCLYVTMISSYHCPGSSMFLLEDSRHRVLITGDIRGEDWWLEELKSNTFLRPYISGALRLDNIYLDTTFSYRGEPYIDIPSNYDGINLLVEQLRSYPLDDPDIQFYFLDSVTGLEEVWAYIAKEFGGSIHLKKDIEERLKVLFQNERWRSNIDQVLSRAKYAPHEEQNSPVFHLCGRKLQDCTKKPKISVKIRQCINFNMVDFINYCLPIKISSLSDNDKKELHLESTTRRGNKAYTFRNRSWILSSKNLELLPADLRLLYSFHSSYRESNNFVSLFSPRQVYACVDSRRSWINGFSIARLFTKSCNNDDKHPPNFLYDLESRNKWGNQRRGLHMTPVIAINRWNLKQCASEYTFVKKLISLEQGRQTGIYENTNLQGLLSDFEGNIRENNAEDGNSGSQNSLCNIALRRNEPHYADLIKQVKHFSSMANHGILANEDCFSNKQRIVVNRFQESDFYSSNFSDSDDSSDSALMDEVLLQQARNESVNKDSTNNVNQDIESWESKYIYEIEDSVLIEREESNKDDIMHNESIFQEEFETFDNLTSAKLYSSVKLCNNDTPVSSIIPAARIRYQNPQPKRNFCDGQRVHTSVMCKSRKTVDKQAISAISDDIESDPMKWFSPKVGSAKYFSR
ncbi:Piso0_002639 [Millerozyma farinosa CBS 7064]|uniref:Piso0_002639 protein n=1 Tax=Pichia sorbitophila (strain ATCC MYA-4447 / BCRC 22081 / CBS 7064 / NBRC 10061 / NRRL Y-12695) TaxID=559304 RepID=G8YD52_PICSO|nr:Piso0_002639 [Millerozyma farinosa CBS 7064]